MRFCSREHIFYYSLQKCGFLHLYVAIFMLVLAFRWYEVCWSMWHPLAADTQTIRIILKIILKFLQYEITKCHYDNFFVIVPIYSCIVNDSYWCIYGTVSWVLYMNSRIKIFGQIYNNCSTNLSVKNMNHQYIITQVINHSVFLCWSAQRVDVNKS